jgi:Flp pilus assembly protein TadB
LFGRIVTALITVALLAVAVMFSVAVLAVAAVGGAILVGWLWWKTRRVRRAMQDSFPGSFDTSNSGRPAQPGGDIIEGEVLKGEWKEDQRP